MDCSATYTHPIVGIVSGTIYWSHPAASFDRTPLSIGIVSNFEMLLTVLVSSGKLHIVHSSNASESATQAGFRHVRANLPLRFVAIFHVQILHLLQQLFHWNLQALVFLLLVVLFHLFGI